MSFYKNEAEIKNMLGLILDTDFYNQNLSLNQIGRLYGSLYNNFSFNQYLDYLNRFNLDSKNKFKHLSKGMKTKAQLAFALSHNARSIM